jgi:hypothetical protein
MQKVRDNAVMTSTAVAAVFRASNNPAAQAAADGIGATFGRQLDKLQEGFTAVLTSVGESLINALNPERVIAAFRGGMDAIKAIIDQITESLGLVMDPKKAEGLESVFRNSRNIVIDIAESLVMAGVKLFDWVKQSAGMFTTVMDKAQLLALQAKKATFVATDPILGGEDRTMLTRALNLATEQDIKNMNKEIMDIRVRLGHAQAAGGRGPVTDTAPIAKTFEAVREKMKKADMEKDAEKKAVEAQNKINDAAKELAKNAEKAAAALENLRKQEKQRVEDLEMINKDLKVKTLDLMRANATAMEEFSRKITDSLNQVKQAAGADAALNLKFKQGLRRQVGKDLEQLIKDFGTAPDQNLPQTMTRGSSAAVEQEIRAKMQLTEQDFQSQLKAAMLNQARQSELQVERLDKLVIAANEAGVFAQAQLNEQKRIADAQKEAAANAAKGKPAVAVAPK